mmetsp:Transcript_84713/g.196972  ORF Transcript_84713/g.196972 Transcript_84713/m.196972 type:complete len:227 (-) Transcript_84713:144-824(-)|eukprot:CAMPEP_0171081240 /NCGR_PEP_ID=MMETSP0766_2-20121228/16376_1 /TAXON_ID=439317 /ORGANISM="Gambierdiscus australes, Strain CAWD 149" /LENGTH=226 /DNA_ID=CAMNT_0011538533 /DNA_START=22 /DNA_END=702 /DNA_ORIENTATION=-
MGAQADDFSSAEVARLLVDSGERRLAPRRRRSWPRFATVLVSVVGLLALAAAAVSPAQRTWRRALVEAANKRPDLMSLREATEERPPEEDFWNCTDDTRWEARWSYEQQHWCCTKKHKGCKSFPVLWVILGLSGLVPLAVLVGAIMYPKCSSQKGEQDASSLQERASEKPRSCWAEKVEDDSNENTDNADNPEETQEEDEGEVCVGWCDGGDDGRRAQHRLQEGKE